MNLIDLEPLTIVAFSSLLGVATYYFKVRQQKKEIKNEAVFDLLGVWHDMVSSRYVVLEGYTESYFLELEILGVNFQNCDIDATMEFFKKTAFDTYPRRSQGLHLIERHKESIKKVSKFDPVLAFQLSSDAPIDELMKDIEDYFEQVSPVLESIESSETKNTLDTFIEETKNNGISVIVEALESNLKRLAFRVGLLTWIRVKFIIWKDNKKRQKLGKDAAVLVFNRFGKEALSATQAICLES